MNVTGRTIFLGRRKKARGIVVPLKNARLVLAWGKKGYVMCGYLNLAVAEKFKDAAAVVTGVKTIGDLLKRPVVACTPAARRAGVRPGMSGLQALRRLA